MARYEFDVIERGRYERTIVVTVYANDTNEAHVKFRRGDIDDYELFDEDTDVLEEDIREVRRDGQPEWTAE